MTTDWLGTPLKIGDTIVYPSMSGRSTQMTEATIISYKTLTQKEYDNLNSYQQTSRSPGELTKAKVLPTGNNSRWDQHWGTTTYGKDGNILHTKQKPVTLTANARSITVITAQKTP